MNTLKWLIRREFWEHKGGLVWAPVGVAALLLGLLTVSVVLALATGNLGSNPLQIGPVELTDPEQIRELLASPDTREAVSSSLSVIYSVAAIPLALTMGFVVLFYFIGALHEDRANRSVLFWKSLPLSDRHTVLSKLATGLVLAPLVTWAVALMLALLVNLVLGIALLFLGVNIFGEMFGHARFYTLALEYLGILPIHALWALPTAGWLLMVSAWARSKPFLWAVGVPLLAAMLLAWLEQLTKLPIDAGWFANHVVERVLFGAVPESWIPMQDGHIEFPDADFGEGSPLFASWKLLATAELWLGALAGAAMLMLAIRLRRYRDEG